MNMNMAVIVLTHSVVLLLPNESINQPNSGMIYNVGSSCSNLSYRHDTYRYVLMRMATIDDGNGR